jgi:predicted DNA-binding transcriptional regulator AlpA
VPNAHAPAPEFVSAHGAARLLSVSVRSFYRLAKDRGIRPVRVAPRLLRYRVEDVRAVVGGEVAK